MSQLNKDLAMAFSGSIKLDLLPPLEKHLQGRHSQQSHAGGRGGGSDLGPVYNDLGLFLYDYDNANDKQKRKERDKLSTQQGGDWSESERAAVAAYQGGSHRAINDSLRDEEAKIDVKSAAQALLIDDAIKKSKPLDKAITVYRGVATKKHSEDREDDARDFFGQLQEGDEFSDSAFTSTTLSPRTASAFADLDLGPDYQGILFRINVPPKVTGIFMNSINPNAGFNAENEYLLPRGSTFRLLRKEGKVWDLEAVSGQ